MCLVWWKIFSKAGHIGAIGLLMWIPLVNIILLLYLAFSEWPIHKELRELRRQTPRYPS
jgi:membrane-anchored protein YejM (alkaline phosphatase superfamily)